MARFTRLRYAFGYLLAAVLLFLAARVISEQDERLWQLISSTPVWLPAIGGVVLCNLAAQGWLLRQLAWESGIEIPRRECLYLAGASSLYEVLILPAAGVAYRGAHLHSVWGVPLASYGAGLAVFAVARLFVWGIPACGGVIWITASDEGASRASRSLWWLLLIAAIVLFVAWIGQSGLRRIAGQRTSRWDRLAENFLRVTSSRRLGASAATAMLACAVIQVLAFHVIFRAAGLPVDIGGSAWITALHQLSGIVALTPGAVGIQEAASLWGSTALDIQVADLLIVLALMRGGRLLIAIIVGAPCWWLLRRHRHERPLPQARPKCQETVC